MVEPTCEMMHRWGQAGILIKKLRMDNAGIILHWKRGLKASHGKTQLKLNIQQEIPHSKALWQKLCFMPWLTRLEQLCIMQTYLWRCASDCLEKFLQQLQCWMD